MLRMKCPTCSRALGIDEAYVGMPGLCPACGTTFTVPAPAVLLDDDPGVSPPAETALSPAPDATQAASTVTAHDLLPETPLALAPDRPGEANLLSDPWWNSDPRRTDAKSLTPEVQGDGLAAENSPEVPVFSAADLLPLPENEPPVPLLSAADLLAVEEPAGLPAQEGGQPRLSLDDKNQPLEAIKPADGISLPSPRPRESSPASDAITSFPLPGPAAEPGPLDWGETPRREVKPVPWPRPRNRSASGFVSLIPGVEDFYLGMIALGVLWLGLSILVLVAPKLFWLPILFGGLIYLGGAFWLCQSMEETNPLWKYLLAFIPLIAVVYVVCHRDRALRPFVITLVGLGLLGVGLAAGRPFLDPPFAADVLPPGLD